MFVVPNEIAMLIRGVLMSTRIPKSKIDQVIAMVSDRLRATGLIKGVSDTIIVLPGKVLFIEFKTDTGHQSDHQKEFQHTVTDMGHEYHIIRSLEQFKSLIESNV